MIIHPSTAKSTLKQFAKCKLTIKLNSQKIEIKISQARRTGECKAQAYCRKSSRTRGATPHEGFLADPKRTKGDKKT